MVLSYFFWKRTQNLNPDLYSYKPETRTFEPAFGVVWARTRTLNLKRLTNWDIFGRFSTRSRTQTRKKLNEIRVWLFRLEICAPKTRTQAKERVHPNLLTSLDEHLNIEYRKQNKL